MASSTSSDGPGPADFFHAQRAAFRDTLARFAGRPDLLDRMWMQAFSSFEHNVEVETEGMPQLACHKGCGTCCQLQVVATMPEVLMVARYVRAMAGGFGRVGVDLRGRLAGAGPAEEPAHPMALGRECPFLAEGLCVIYPVRPMACRGHASFDKEACVSALCGGAEDVPVSGAHRAVRGLVQSALQSALHDAGLPWGVYDLVGALRLALAHADGEAAFRAGEDFMMPAAADRAVRADMGAAFVRLGLA
ncbi:YkgJ family cysteine cluster protein [Xanthobacter tagetidis]|uniref:YkgJ family cysteine cluster protein n=1 Tax=Xanthobacter tagetidis TaxID=60216 RepID=A0A3L7AAJ2_9HYPH|nr:YkgJ family cysteine cluster protein [Xanthobacter tagetidis]MBB6309375.1 Fe-S-cluster containining protein [Xanthobacter tagetidis]RLP76681.1 YkgJ family cysteine cluster protein [Xanthobacter tagetidis]